MLILLVRLRHLSVRMGWREKIGYLVLGIGFLFELLLGLGPFMRIVDPALEGGETLIRGFDLAYENAAGDFRVLFGIAIGLTCIAIIAGFAMFFTPGVRGETSLFWFLVFVAVVHILAIGIAYNYYLIGFTTGQQSKGVSISIEWAGILYDIFIFLPWIGFFLLRHFFLGGGESTPIFGTGLDGR